MISPDPHPPHSLHLHLPGALGLREFVLMMSALMAMTALSIDTMLPALSDIGRDLHVSNANNRQSVITLFFMGMAFGSLFYGPLADHFGRRPVLIGALVLMLISTLLCTFAPSMALLLVGRFMAGFCAAACRVIVLSVVRDCYRGDMMARIMSLIMFTFMIVPMAAPSLGALLLFIAPWRFIFGLLAILIGGMLVWLALRLPETLDPAHRIPVHPRELAHTFVRVISNRSSLGYMLASGVMMGGLLGFLVSVQQIFFDVFHAPGLLPLGFALISAWMAAGNLLNGKMVQRFGARRMSQSAVIAVILLSAVHYFIAKAELENVWIFILIQGMTTLCFSFAGVNFSAIAMEPFARGAGFASSFQASLTTFISVILGGVVGAAFDGTTLPIALGFLGFGSGTLLLILWAERGKLFTRPRHAHLRVGQ
ncbi:multidrug effflux MFS transporter [Sphingobium sp. DEHP117]|uniref:multidrug effflux MFS transporter n=1 Tax=Sphingobium sp. DEHP117 TaxID=2993436 RepID=UPI0027D66FFC|nr:Bcr/CflA family efflux MFS transporter [Sphingobium sp. DEHP117]MDQ4419183.1 multidrug effflux MFS transporter [Sphingobium sp. DEHP117]